jgi:hypothetical protein
MYTGEHKKFAASVISADENVRVDPAGGKLLGLLALVL